MGISSSRQLAGLACAGAVLLAAAMLPVTAATKGKLPYGLSPLPAGVNLDNYAAYTYIKSGDCSDGDDSKNDLPANFDCVGNWKFSDYRDQSHLSLLQNPQEFYGVEGAGTNRAWEVTTGRPDVVISIVDSGIEWNRGVSDSNLLELRDKLYLNRGELPRPICANGKTGNPDDQRFGGYDCNGDGVFNVEDYASDPGVSDKNGNGVIDPEDLILTFSDGVDDDYNGYVDDIAGWDFYNNDNDPLDNDQYGHGTHQAGHAAGEAGLGGRIGQCPNCMIMPLRVGSSFVASGDNYAQAVVYSVDNGVNVIEEALGSLTHTSFAQIATNYAYHNGVIVHASEADEAAEHHMYPAALEHTMVVNSIRTPSLPAPAALPFSYLYLNGCTNYGANSYVAIPSTSCSSEATGDSSGISGLLVSAAKNAVDRGDMTDYIRDDGSKANYPLSVNEMKQLWRLAADDIDFSTPCPQHAGCKDAGDFLSVLLPGLVGTIDGPLPDPIKTPLTQLADLLSVPLNKLPDISPPLALPNNYATTTPIPTLRYPTVQGWDYFTGYGRANNGRLLRMIGIDGDPKRIYGSDKLTAQQRIPPEASISAPLWWTQYPYKQDQTLKNPNPDGDKNDIVVKGHAAANRVTAAGGSFDWVLEWAPGAQAQGWPNGDHPATGSQEKSGGPWTVAASGQGLTHAKNGEFGRIPITEIIAAQNSNAYPFNPDPTSSFKPSQYAVRLRLRVIAHPTDPNDDVNNEAVFQKQVDVYPEQATVIRDDLGRDGARSGIESSPVFADLNGDGTDELIIATNDGLVHAYTNVATGRELPGWPVHTLPIASIPGTGDNAYTRDNVPSDFYYPIMLGSPAIADLDGNGRLEVIVGDLSGHVYVWNADASMHAGFPVHVNYTYSQPIPCKASTIPNCEIYSAHRRVNQYNRRNAWITAAPSVGRLDKNYPGLDIVAGAGDGHIYAWHADGTPVPGWPVLLRDPATVASVDPVTDFYTFKDGVKADEQGMVVTTPSLGDVDGDGNLNVVTGVNEEYTETPDADLLTSALSGLLGNAGAGLLSVGNARLYVLHHDGSLHPADAADVNANVASTAQPDDQAYLKGWPVKMAMVDTGLLPDVGEGTDAPPVLADLDGNGTLDIAAASVAGPAYVFKANGHSYYGKTLSTTNTLSELAVNDDTPVYVAASAMAIGSMDGGNNLTIAAGTAGLQRVLDLALTGNQILANDYLSLWNAQTGLYELGAPVVVNDLQFFDQPIFADVNGDGRAEVIQSSAVNDTVIVGQGLLGLGRGLGAKRLHSGGWIVSSAAVGTAPMGDKKQQNLSMVTSTREGYLRIYPTTTPIDGSHNCAALSQWPKYQHDHHNTGNYEIDAQRPYPLTNITAKTGDNGQITFSFTATGNDRDCGRADHYEVRRAPSKTTGWNEADKVADVPVNTGPGQADSFVTKPLSGDGSIYLLRAFDAAGNGSAVSAIALDMDNNGRNPGAGNNTGNTPVDHDREAGCSLAAAPQAFDPTLLLLLAVALLLCWRDRSRASRG